MPTDFDPSHSLILVVDDDRAMRTVLSRFLSERGFQVMEAEDGKSALHILGKLPVDLVLLDFLLPGMDGTEVCTAIHKLEHVPPVLIMTGVEGNSVINKVYRAGAVDYVRKPLHWPMLFQRVKYILQARRATQETQFLTQKYEMILDTVESGISGLDREARITYINQTGLEMLGYENPGELIGRRCQEIFRIARAGSASIFENCVPFLSSGRHDTSAHFDEVRMERKDGSAFLADLRAKPIVQENRLTGGVIVFQDITERQKAAQLIRHMANHDNLTSLPNRNFLLQRLPRALSLARRQGRALFLLFIDLDRFKPVNDQYGHAVGDAVLIQVAKRLSETMRASDSVCRLGGDEFVILLESAATLHGAIMVAERAIELLNQPIQPMQASELSCSIGASIGIAVFPDDAENAEELLRHADQAMYVAKKKGRNCWHLYGDSVSA